MQPAHHAAFDVLASLQRLWGALAEEEQLMPVLALLATCIMLTVVTMIYIFKRARPVYLLNYCVYKPPDEWKCSSAEFLRNSQRCGVSTDSLVRAFPSTCGTATQIAPCNGADEMTHCRFLADK